MRPTTKQSRILFCMAGLLFVLSGCSQQTALFNGRNLDGWRPVLADPDADPSAVWLIQDGVLHCTGVPNGYILTQEDYSDYQLHVEWRWTDKPTNSGVLLHVTGEDKIWPKCIEAQLMYQNAGDFYAIGGPSFTELKDGRRLEKRHPSNETPPGEWNTYDIICAGDTITLYVNGLLQNQATGTSVSRGKIGLQSEGSPIEFRNITLTPIR